MTTRELAELHDNINRAFERIRLGKLATERVGWKPDGETTPILPMILEDAINIARNEVRGLLNAALMPRSSNRAWDCPLCGGNDPNCTMDDGVMPEGEQ